MRKSISSAKTDDAPSLALVPRGTQPGALAQCRLRRHGSIARGLSPQGADTRPRGAPIGAIVAVGTQLEGMTAVKSKLALWLGLLATTSVFPPIPASAQAVLPPYEIITSVRS